MMFLTKDEVADLTGCKIRDRQMRWLASNGYKYEVGMDGVPKVLRSFVESRLGFEGSRAQVRRPNFEVLINAAAQKNA
jgi:hypothetical protein